MTRAEKARALYRRLLKPHEAEYVILQPARAFVEAGGARGTVMVPQSGRGASVFWLEAGGQHVETCVSGPAELVEAHAQALRAGTSITEAHIHEEWREVQRIYASGVVVRQRERVAPGVRS